MESLLPDTHHSKVIKEFVVRAGIAESGGGTLVVRDDHYGSMLAKFDRLFEVIASDALGFEPPLVISRDQAEIVKYGGRSYAQTFGIEVRVPAGHLVSQAYKRRAFLEDNA
jgi:hypothetical protein